ncbi:metallophosphoesterase [Altererythrobacter arenosus]|uniref:Metallophosphoesterase n=1 Tax=Altererythrobacter arenosus TaxID=3032592 RepID=A0ABY8FUE2_9SPHN|nr:metallophosphoesterase [Altererythrobacter sp. CAU 1644]WFL78628.1 metallophosphoesterase [Altererythrobacter sp. CAU 1644]
MSDTHWGVENRAALEAVAAAAAVERPDALISTGDITQRATHTEFSHAEDFFARFDAPVILCAGNHDMPYYNLWERFTDPYRRFRKLYAAVGGEFVSDDVVLVPLKTTVRAQPRFPWSDGFVMREALEATLTHLRSLTGDERLKIVTCHHPLLPGREGEKNPTIGGDEAFAAIAAAGADAVISGHVHFPFDLMPARGGLRLRMIGTGTLSTRLRGAPPGYNVLTCCKEDGISVEHRSFGG